MSKTIVITGAGAGLGRAFARRFATDGDQVVLLGRTLAKVEEVAAEIGERALALACDICSADSVRTAFAAIGERFGCIDVLINNAAYVQRTLCEEAADEEIFNAFVTNNVGPAYCSRAAIPLLKKGGQIINISSGAVDSNYPGYALYGASKAGLERLSLGLHEELQPRDISVTYVRCGQMMEKIGDFSHVDPAMLEQAIKMGQDPRERPTTTFASVAATLRHLIDLPGDLRLPVVVIKPRKVEASGSFGK